MPSGETHELIGAGVAGLVLGAAVAVKTTGLFEALTWPQVAGLAAGLGMGLLVTPDLDQTGRSLAGGRLRRMQMIGRLLARVYATFWWPYSRLVRHRSPLSHAPLLGTAGRAVYLLIWAWAIQLLLQVDWLGVVTARWPAESILFLAGWAIQDTVHWAADYF